MTPLLYGLVAAVGWGVADYLGAVASRRIGVFRTTFGMQLSSLVVFVAILAAAGELPPPRVDAIAIALAMGAFAAVLVAALYRSLALGPIAVVSPIVAANAAITVVLAVAFLGEVLSGGQAIAIVATIAGIVLASMDWRLLRENLRPTEGVRLAIFTMVGFGILGLLLATTARAFGALPMVLLLRFGTTTALAAYAAARRIAPAVPRAAVPTIVVIGLLDTAANVAFGVGATAGYASIVATGASSYPLIPFVLGVTVLRERIAPNQIAGIALLVGGLVSLGLA